MNQDLLQERFERLEGGEPLETCLVGLPHEEADLLKVAASLRSISYPSRMAEHAAEQRASLLRAARQRNPRISPSTPQPTWRLWSWTPPWALPGLLVLAAASAAVPLALSALISDPGEDATESGVMLSTGTAA